MADINPNTNVPVKGAWICCVCLAIPSFFMDLESITKVISCGNLMTYSFVSACGIALRFRDRETQTSVRAPTEKYVWLFLVVTYLTALVAVKYRHVTWAVSILGSLSVLTLVRLCFVEQTNKPRRGHYTMPLVPVLPAVGIFFNFILACGLDGTTWGLFGAFLAIGIVIYFSYGMWHSNLEPGNVTRGQLEMSLVSGANDSFVGMGASSLSGVAGLNNNSSLNENYIPPSSTHRGSEVTGDDGREEPEFQLVDERDRNSVN